MNEPAALGTQLIGTIAALIAVLALAWIVLRVVKRLPMRQGSAQPIQFIAARAVGPRERVVLIEVDGRRLLIGVGGGVTLLADLTETATNQARVNPSEALHRAPPTAADDDAPWGPS